MKAVVMAGGFGTRIQPLTHSRPKPMLPIINKPMMEHTMMMLKDLGITEFIVLLYFKPEIIQDYFKDGSEFGIKVSYVVPDADYGTAGAVKLAQEYIGDENFIIVSGDLVTDFDFKKLFDFHADKKSQLSIGLTSVENPLQFGVVIANEDNVIEKFLEKPSWGEVFSDTINTGIYIIEPEILDFIPRGENFDFAKDLFPLLMKKDIELMGLNLSGYWRDVGNPESYREVFEDILNGKVKLHISGKKKEYPDGVLYSHGKNELDHSVDIIGTVILGENIKIGKNTKLNNVVIGNNVTIGSSCKIRNSVLWEDIVIEKNVHLDNSVICNNNFIGKNVTAKAGLILAQGCEIGQLASFNQDVTIWPDKKVEPASIINHNLVLGNKYKNSIFENGSVAGKSNIELSCEMTTKLAEAFAAQLPVGSTVIVGRDHDKSSRMLKRAFLGGLLSAGINVVDIKSVPSSVLRYTLANDDNLVGGAHFKRCTSDTTDSIITLFNEEAIRIDSNSAKSVEKSFFTEKFRRVDFTQIGTIHETTNHIECVSYKEAIENNIDHGIMKCGNFKVAVDLMHGVVADLFPQVLNHLGVENIVLNSYYDEKKLFNISMLEKNAHTNISAIVTSLEYDMGLIIYPNAQQLSLVSEDGVVLNKIIGLYSVLELLNIDSKDRKKRVFLPSWAPDIKYFENLEIQRGKYSNFKASQLKQYDLIATVDGNFAFTEFGYTRDAMYASLKIMELLSCHNIKLSELAKSIDEFYYKAFEISCSQALKGKMMRKFLEDSKGKKSSSADGVKIWEDENDWILMIPDQYRDSLNIYIQATDEKNGEAIYEKYTSKIAVWSQE
ncbi:mannose-1-phosphate guanylyltransferase / phosphomannomutase [Epsilonproteobacteria bacterium SCGC AD-308-P11]|jgi:mannose-1-phosphate guanylyltransferase / phosphomannomutase|nr:mannose-1-phosphate guanylyltransferase / phosphomannomutase [Epsilonproteobacteria bacterium SCGC AD-308-O04]SMP89177.1 mannose-1-phosphate guanylyltransferase / phosphomannomutase [Epsilonproteobacteria bacterium SCGC AD-308-P11]